MQGLKEFIPSTIKATYINLLLKVGFDTIDFGSFVSAKAVPQMSDTEEVLNMLDVSASKTKLLAIVVNLKGADIACKFHKISYLGYPFSISETFQKKNTNTSIQESLAVIEDINNSCVKNHKKMIVYLSMGFGNPYGDFWHEDIVTNYAEILRNKGINDIRIADTTGVSTPEKIKQLFPKLLKIFPSINWGLHLHSTPQNAEKNIEAAFETGCNRFDSALRGFGGCPFAQDKLTGNIATETVIKIAGEKGINLNLNFSYWQEAMNYSSNIFH